MAAYNQIKEIKWKAGKSRPFWDFSLFSILCMVRF